MKQIKYEDLSLRWKSSKENVLNEISALIDSEIIFSEKIFLNLKTNMLNFVIKNFA